MFHSTALPDITAPFIIQSFQVFDSKTGVFVKREEAGDIIPDQVLMPPPPEPKHAIKEPVKPISKSKIFKCMECHRGFKREIKLIKHVTRKHAGNKVRRALPTSAVGGRPVEGSLKLTPMGCPDCTVIFDNEDDLMFHFTKNPHNLTPSSNRCPVLTCDMNFQSRDKLIQHMRAGKHGQPCPQCGKSFSKVSMIIF